MKLLAFALLALSFYSTPSWAQSSGQNLIANGSFEEGSGLSDSLPSRSTTALSGWAILPANPVELQYKKFGNYFPSQGDVKVLLNNSVHAALKQSVAVEAGKYYYLSFDYAPGTTNEGGSYVEVKVNGESVAVLSSANDVWSKNEIKVKAYGPSMEIFFEGTGQGNLRGGLIDNVRLYKAINDFYSDNLLQNGSFEEFHSLTENTRGYFTSLGRWKTDVTNAQPIPFKVIDKADNDKNYIKSYDKKNLVTLDAGKNASILQTIQTSLGSDYELSGYFTPKGNSSAATNQVQVFVNGILRGTLSSATPKWVPFTFTFNADKEVSFIEFRAIGTEDGNGGCLDLISLRRKRTGIIGGIVSFLGLDSNILVNGSFEDTPPFPSHQKWATFTSISGWTTNSFIGGSIPFEVQTGNNLGYQAREGRSKLELDATANTKIYQDLNTFPGRKYLLEFSYAPGKAGDPATNGADVQWNGTTILGLNGSATKWTDYSQIVTATAETSKLAFIGTGTSDGEGALIDSISVRELGASNPPLADFSVTKIGSFPNAQLLIDGSLSSDDGSGLTYTWKFDGPTITETSDPLTILNITSPGFYRITLVVKDADGNASYFYKKIYVGEGDEISEVEFSYDIIRDPALTQMPPISVAAVSVDEAIVGSPVLFDASSSFSFSGSIVSYRFVFGDGTELITTSPVISHIYTTSGSFQPFVVVTDAQGKTSTSSFGLVNILAPENLEAKLALSAVSGRAPFTVSLDAGSSLPLGKIAEYYFDFGDGTDLYSDASAVQHTFFSAGTYVVKVRVTGAPPYDGTDEETVSITVLPKDDLPVVALSTSALEGKAPFQVLFDASLSRDDYGISTYEWDFKDGSTIQSGPQLKRVTHTFTQAGTYPVVLKVKDSIGQESTKTVSVKVLGTPEHLADFSILNNTGIFPATITFDASTVESKTELFEYVWTVNGQTITKRTPVLNVTFTGAGTYPVTLKTIDRAGRQNTKTKSFNLASAVDSADFTYTSTTTVAGASYQFDGSLSTDLTAVERFHWEFGEGTAIDLQSPTVNHLFTVPGTYQVKLRTDYVGGQSSEKIKTIIVSPNITPVPTLQLSALAGAKDVEFTAFTSASLDDEAIVLYELDFGDGTTPLTSVAPISATHAYHQNGDYRIKLSVHDRQGKVGTTEVVYSTNNPSSSPVANFSANTLEGNPKLAVSFDATSSTDDVGIVKYIWTLSNGTTFTKTTPVFNYTFTETGTYQVSLSVIDADGFSSQKTTSIRVNSAPVARFIASVDNSIFPAKLLLDASSSTDDAEGLSYSWMLDDGTLLIPSTGAAVSSLDFSDRGEFVVRLRVTDRNGLSSTVTKEIRTNMPPIARAIVGPMIGEYPMTVTLNALVSSDDTMIESFRWETLEGELLSDSALFQKTFLEPGFYALKLTVTDDEGGQSSVVYPITVQQNPLPVARFAYELSGTTIPATVAFDAGSSTDNRQIDFYRWDFGGTIVQTSTAKINHTFTQAGPKTITLTVVDDQGSTSSTSQVITFKANTAPSVQIASSTSEGNIPLVVTFDASGSSDAESDLTFSWDFGDGSSPATGKRVSHTYRATGSYQVTLTATDAQGLSASQSLIITAVNDGLADSRAPGVFPNVTTPYIAKSEPELVLALKDVSKINYQTLRISLNDVALTSSHLEIDEDSDIVRVKFTSPYGLQTNGSLKLGLRVADEHGNFLARGFYFKVLDGSELIDSAGPVVNFSPEGGDTQNLSPMITAGLYDFTGVDYDSISVTLNGNAIPSSSIIREPERNRFRIQLGGSYQLLPNAINKLLAAVRDTAGNVSLVGVGYDTRDDKTTIVTLPLMSPIGGYAAGRMHTCAQDDNGIKCWGDNQRGALGLNSDYFQFSDPKVLPYVDVAGDRAKRIFASHEKTCIINQDDDVRCWGRNSQGSLGIGRNGDIGDNETPGSIPVLNIGAKVKDLAVGQYHNCALTVSNKIICWGYGGYGALGNGSDENIGDNEHPVASGIVNLGAFGDVKEVSVGDFHTCALNFQGQVKCWGANVFSILGIDSPNSLEGIYWRQVADVPNLNFPENVVQISGSGNMTCARLESGAVRCWGVNAQGALGIGSTQTFSEVDVANAPNVGLGYAPKWIGVAVGGFGACAIDPLDRAKCWGSSQDEQINSARNNIGDDELPSSQPFLNLHEKIVTLSSGERHKCAKLADDTLNCWGAIGWYNDPGNPSQWRFDDPNFRYYTVLLTTSTGSDPTLKASVASSAQSGIIPLQVSFDASSSSSTDGQIVNYSWDFGDNSPILSTATPTVSHTFTQAGVFQVKMTVRNANGSEATANIPISANSGVVLPVARIDLNQEAVKLGDSVAFGSGSSSDPFGSSLAYHWNFGDGTVVTTSSQNVTHTYSTLGLFLATLTVESPDGRVSVPTFRTVFVNAINELPRAQFNCTSGDYTVNCVASQSVDFDGTIESYRWEMGDGEVLFGKTVDYTYAKPGRGKFQVKLTVTDNSGGEDSKVSPFYVFDHAAPVVSTNLQSNRNFPQAKILYSLNISDESETITEVFVNGVMQLSTESKQVDSYLSLQNGSNEVIVKSRDKAGNASADLVFSNITAVNTVPSIALSAAPGELTKVATQPLTFSISDDGDTKTSVIVNNQVVVSDASTKDFSLSLTLQEGVNRIEIITFDESKQKASRVIDNVILDTIPPRVVSISPKSGAEYVGNDQVTFSGSASEPLSVVTFDGEPAELDTSKKSFTLQKTVSIEGSKVYAVTLTDRAGNSTTVNHTYSMILHILYPDLIALVSEENQLRVVGQAGAARFPGQKIEISGGWFNSTEVYARADGSFEGTIRKSTTVDVNSYSPELNFQEGHRLLFQNDTTLSGIIRDIAGTPLPGVKVTISSTGLSGTTDASGVFSIPNSSAGDQKIEIDGTLVPETITQGLKKYSRTYLNVSMGHLERNVLEDPIYLTPIYLDGSETVVEPEAGAMVTSARAPGVLIEIPAGTVSFPTGTEVEVGGELKNVINVAQIDADKTSVPAPDFAVPEKVYSLEPSGVTFSEPVKLTLPNDNEFEDGTPVIIMSKNSSTGMWEIDGSGKVNGASIETDPGQGITHFSEVYAVPYGLEIKSRDNGELPSIDSQSGGLSTSIAMPSFKVMGQDVTPSLIYNSSWANPNAVVSNVLNLVRDYQVRRVNDGVNLFGVFGGSGTVTQEVWTSPESVTSKFYVDDVEGNEAVFDVTKAPNQAVISYALDLSSLASGQYFAKATYAIKYKFLTLTTTRIEENTAGIKKIKTKKDRDVTYDTIFPDPLGQIVYVQNKSNSAYGRGWKLGLTQEILNPRSSRLLVEESNGAPSSYILDNSIETLVYDARGIQAASLDSSSSIQFVRADGKVAVVNLNEGDEPTSVIPDEQYDIPAFNVDQRIQLGYKAWRSGKKCSGQKVQGECLGHDYYEFTVGCQDNVYNVQAPKRISDFLNIGGQAFYLDERGAFYKFGNSESLLAGNVGTQPKMVAAPSSRYPDLGQLCSIKYGVGCASSNETYHLAWQRLTKQRNPNFTPSFSYCGPLPAFTAPALQGNFPNTGYAAGSLSQSKFNDPRDVSPSVTEGETFFVADTGNNVVRKINLTQNTVTDFAGNRQTQATDQGDGIDATGATIYHPKAVVSDSIGNVYIASERGIIWKVTPENQITMLAGKNRRGVPGDSETFNELRLENPSGLALDEVNKILYVADTNQHRIVAMDLETKVAQTVAGKYECQSGPEFVRNRAPALDVHLCYPEKIGLDENRNLLVLDKANKMIRRINLKFTQSGGAYFAATTKDGSKIERLANGSFIRIYRDGTRAYFSSTGKHLSTRDQLNNTTTFEYDGEGRLVRAVDPKGGESVVGYSGNHISFFRDPANRTTQFQFNGNDLVSTIYPDATQKFFEYQGPANLMSKEYNQRSFATRYDYNIWKRLSKITRPDATSVSSTEALTSTIANGSSASDPKEAQSFGENNEDGNELVEIYKNAKGIETKFNKDLKGYVSEITDTKGLKTKIERDDEGRPIRIDRPDSSYSTFKYNSFGDLIESYESASDTKNTFAYNSDGNPTLASTEIGAVLKTKSLQYYSNGLVFKEIDYNNRSITREYFGNGLLASTKNDLDEELAFQYDSKGNLYRRTAPMGEETITVRDLAGNILRKIDAKGVTTRYTYDSFNRLTSVETGITAQRSEGDVTLYAYNEAGSLISITDPHNNVTAFEYDSMERLKKKTTHLGQVTILTYDQNGNVKTELDPNQNLKTFVYNDSDELVQKILPDNGYTMEYDDFGNLLKVTDNDSVLEYTYEKIMGEYMVTSAKSQGTDLPTVNLVYSFDDFGNRTGMSTPFGNFSYSYDHGNRLTGLQNHLGQNFGFTYDNANRLKLITRPGSSTMMDFDANSFVSGVTHKKGSQIVNQQTFERDAVGNKIRITSSRGVANFTYDQDSQLKSSTNTEAPAPYQAESFNYDSLGNRTNDQLGAYAYDQKKSRLLEDYKFFYAYDDNGNLITRTAKGLSGTVTNFVYTSENQLKEVHETVSFVQTKSSLYSYDAAGRRSKKIVIDHNDPSKSFERHFVFDGNERLADFDHYNEVLAVHTHSGLRTDDTLATQITYAGRTSGLAQASGSFFYLKDSLGTITDVVNDNGSLIQHYVYSSFGKIVKISDASEQITANPFLKPDFTFTNREFDEETGLYYYRARYYEAGIGRFIQEDPHPGIQSSPDTLISKYIYAFNNPGVYADPNGKLPFLVALAVSSLIVGAISAGISAGTSGGNFLENLFSKGGLQSFAVGFASTFAVGLGGYAAGAIVGAFGGSAIAAQITGAIVGGFIGGTFGATNSPKDRKGLGFFLGFVTGAVGGFMAAGSGFNFTKDLFKTPGSRVSTSDWPLGHTGSLSVPPVSDEACVAAAIARGVRILNKELFIQEACQP